MLLQNVSGAQTVTIPPGSTILVIAPLTGSVSHRERVDETEREPKAD
jgi:hypothetical protein